MLDFNRTDDPLSETINTLTELVEPREENVRQYLGASMIGSECMRKIQYDWLCDPVHPLRLRNIFARGHFFEELSREQLKRAGFVFAPAEQLEFKALGGFFRSHADGILVSGPALPGVGYRCLWEHKCLNAKNWRAVDRDGLDKAFPQYAAQVAIYQSYLGVTENPALFPALNANTCERIHFLVPFNAERAQYWKDRAVTIIEATRAGELLPRFTEDSEDWRCKMCGHRERCWT